VGAMITYSVLACSQVLTREASNSVAISVPRKLLLGGNRARTVGLCSSNLNASLFAMQVQNTYVSYGLQLEIEGGSSDRLVISLFKLGCTARIPWSHYYGLSSIYNHGRDASCFIAKPA